MICPFMTTDPASDMKPCVQHCALRYKNMCSFNVIAQALYKQTKQIATNPEKAQEPHQDSD